jgi:hypothetical protein
LYKSKVNGGVPVNVTAQTTESAVQIESIIFTNGFGFNKTLLEFGLRRAQGPMSGMMASKYSIVGGFDSIVLLTKVLQMYTLVYITIFQQEELLPIPS